VSKKGFLLIVEGVLWGGFVLTMLWLWDRRLIPGPHGPIRWGAGRLGRTSLEAVVLVLGSLPFLSIATTKGQLRLLNLGSSVPGHLPDFGFNPGSQ